jgi:hypothetical protein
MAEQTKETWPPGTRVGVLDRTRRMTGVVCWQGHACEEEGAPTYHVKFDNGTEADMCSTVLVRMSDAGAN